VAAITRTRIVVARLEMWEISPVFGRDFSRTSGLLFAAQETSSSSVRIWRHAFIGTRFTSKFGSGFSNGSSLCFEGTLQPGLPPLFALHRDLRHSVENAVPA
jgi:hypothetical protein